MLLLKFSAPAVMGIVVNAAYNIINRVFIGRTIGSLGIAGITVLFPMGLFFMAIGMLIGIGTSVLFAISLGKGDKEGAEKILGNAFITLLSISFIFGVLCILFIDPVLRFLGASAEVFPYAHDFGFIVFGGAVFQTTAMGLNAFIRASGRPILAMFTLMIGAVINVILDIIFILWLGWGMKGAAWATVIAQAVTFVWALLCFTGKGKEIVLKTKNFIIDLKMMAHAFKIGLAQFILQISGSVLVIILNQSLLKYGGNNAVAAMGITSSVNVMLAMPIIGISQGMQPIISYNLGRKKYQIIYHTLRLAMLWGAAILTFSWLLIQLFSTQIVMLFNSTDTALISLSAHTLRVFNLALPFVTIIILATGFFQAAGRAKQAIFMALARQTLFLIPLLLILPHFYQLDGVLYAGPISDIIVTVIAFFMLKHNVKKLLKRRF